MQAASRGAAHSVSPWRYINAGRVSGGQDAEGRPAATCRQLRPPPMHLQVQCGGRPAGHCRQGACSGFASHGSVGVAQCTLRRSDCWSATCTRTDRPFMFTLQDSNINLWWTDNGVRAGSFDGHNGVVWTVDMTCERAGLPQRHALSLCPGSAKWAEGRDAELLPFCLGATAVCSCCRSFCGHLAAATRL